MEALISSGHPPAEVWKMTPKRLEAMLFIASKRRANERLADFTAQSIATRGDKKQVADFAKDLQK